MLRPVQSPEKNEALEGGNVWALEVEIFGLERRETLHMSDRSPIPTWLSRYVREGLYGLAYVTMLSAGTRAICII